MKGWIRLGIVVSAFWIGGTCVFAIAEFLLRDLATCRSLEAFLDATEIFFRCNKIDNHVPGAIDRFFLDFRPTFFLVVALAPIASGWALAAVLVHSIRWVIRGFKG